MAIDDSLALTMTMVALFCVTYFAIVFVPHLSVQQDPLPYVDGYRSSCKVHQAGNINLILSAPHGGNLMPADVPDRIAGGCRRSLNGNPGVCTWFYNDACLDGERCKTTTVQDYLSDEFAENVANELTKKSGFKPFVIIGKWSRKKVDFNREIEEAALNHPEAMSAHRSYHMNIDHAVSQIDQQFGKGLLIDIHGHSQGNYTMVGYLLTGDQLNQDDLSHVSTTTSIEKLCWPNRNECIRGRTSLGTALEANGLGVAFPSLFNPKPGNRTFFSGGFITRNYISKINAIQTELPYNTRAAANRLDNAKKYAQALVDYMQMNNLLQSS